MKVKAEKYDVPQECKPASPRGSQNQRTCIEDFESIQCMILPTYRFHFHPQLTRPTTLAEIVPILLGSRWQASRWALVELGISFL